MKNYLFLVFFSFIKTKDLSTSRLHEAIYVNKLLPVVCKVRN